MRRLLVKVCGVAAAAALVPAVLRARDGGAAAVVRRGRQVEIFCSGFRHNTAETHCKN